MKQIKKCVLVRNYDYKDLVCKIAAFARQLQRYSYKIQDIHDKSSTLCSRVISRHVINITELCPIATL